jgi:hypothetical protein
VLICLAGCSYQPNIVFMLTDDQDTRLSGTEDVYSDIGSMVCDAATCDVVRQRRTDVVLTY